MRNSVTFKVYGKYALFTDPVTKIGGEKFSYPIPTYQALKGILESIYWKPTLIWHIDKLRVMKSIRTHSRNVKPLDYSDKHSLAIYTYLADVEYQVEAHFEWNMNRKDLESDRNEHKHHQVARRMIDRGGRRDIFLGTRECQGYVEPCKFGEDDGFYDHYGELAMDLMFHGFDYPDESGVNELHARFWRPTMVDGIIAFPPPEACTVRKFVKRMTANPPKSIGLAESGLLDNLSSRRSSHELASEVTRHL